MEREVLEHYGWTLKEGEDLEAAWQQAMRSGRFTMVEAEAGDIMYMCSKFGIDYFKDKNTRSSR